MKTRTEIYLNKDGKKVMIVNRDAENIAKDKVAIIDINTFKLTEIDINTPVTDYYNYVRIE